MSLCISKISKTYHIAINYWIYYS